VPAIDVLLNTGANAAAVRSEIARAIAGAIINDLEHPWTNPQFVVRQVPPKNKRMSTVSEGCLIHSSGSWPEDAIGRKRNGRK